MASIQRRKGPRGARYDVRWRPSPTEGERSKAFPTLEAARAFKAQIEADQARAAAADPRIRAMILVAAFAGLRFGELRGLRIRHYDRLAGTLRVEEAVDKRLRRKAPKTAAGVREVHIPRFVLDAVDAHLAEFAGGGPDAPSSPASAAGS